LGHAAGAGILKMDRCDVAIVGFGPTGATLAKLLGLAGHRVVAIERDTDVYQLPRAVHFDHEVMRLFQGMGIADRVLPHTRAAERCQFWSKDREVLVDVAMSKPTRLGWLSDYMFHQPSLERVLRDAASEEPSVDPRLGCELVGLRDVDGEVEIEVRGPDRSTSLVRARHVVGADGANSFVRTKIGMSLDDLVFDEPWVVVDIRGATSLPDEAIQLCDPARPTTHIPCAHGFNRFEFMLLPHEKPEDMERPETLQALMEPWLRGEQVEIVRAAVYRFHALVAGEWLRGNVSLAGDAAHQTPPFLGQGMCAGIRDAGNLAWKLDRVLKGASSPSLLESYAEERSPHVREFISRAVQAGKIICVQDPAIAEQRDAALLESKRRGEQPPIGTELPFFEAGFIQDSENPDRHPLVGTLPPQPRVRGESGDQLLDDFTGGGFRLVLRSDAGFDAGGVGARVAALGGSSVVWSDAPVPTPGGLPVAVSVSPEAEEFFDEHGIAAFLVRPDHVLFGVARTPAEIDALVGAAEEALA
jgi:3-(3-hydroxy-phenyl)propionate hydroxylase